MTPISAPISMNSPPWVNGNSPPSPKASPPSRISGIGEMPQPARRVRLSRPIPRIERAYLDEDERAVVHPGVSRSGDDADEVVEAVARADGDERVPAVQEVGRPRRRKDFGLAHDRDDGAAGARACLRVAQGATDERRVGPHGDLLDGEPRGLLPQSCELREDQRAAEHLAQRRRLVVGERDRLARAVRVVLVGEGELPAAVAEVEHREPAAFVGDDVMANTDPGQFGALDVGGHAYIMALHSGRRSGE